MVPPARFAISFMKPRRMMITAKSMADQNGITAVAIERAIGFKDQLMARQHCAAGQCEWLFNKDGLWAN